MYRVESSGALARARQDLFGRRGTAVPSTVVLLGVCSLLTDVSSEMVATVLPLYLVGTLGFSPLQFGVIDGLYQGAGAFVRLIAGYAGDRWRRHKAVASVGYGISAVSKLALTVAGSAFGAISAIVLVDRAGKGIRTAPRDAMISLSSSRERLGASFGVHRAMDTAGAMLGPLIAFGLLALAPGSFRTLFFISFCFALVGVAVLLLLVDDPSRRAARAPAAAPPRLRGAVDLLRVPALRRLTIVAVALGLTTVSDGFIYLILQKRLDFDVSLFPLLFTGTAIVYMLLAAPAGRLADRVGRTRVFLGGYGLLVLVYGVVLGLSAGVVGLCLALALLGCYYAATDGVLMALGSACVPDDLRGSGLALLGTAQSGARLVASVLFGALWTLMDDTQPAIAIFAGALVVALGIAVLALRRSPVHDVG
jgi:MFS family permease